VQSLYLRCRSSPSAGDLSVRDSTSLAPLVVHGNVLLPVSLPRHSDGIAKDVFSNTATQIVPSIAGGPRQMTMSPVEPTWAFLFTTDIFTARMLTYGPNTRADAFGPTPTSFEH
jgi:hypothetical protein